MKELGWYGKRTGNLGGKEEEDEDDQEEEEENHRYIEKQATENMLPALVNQFAVLCVPTRFSMFSKSFLTHRIRYIVSRCADKIV